MKQKKTQIPLERIGKAGGNLIKQIYDLIGEFLIGGLEY